MKCVIYRAVRKPDAYLYSEREADFSRVPACSDCSGAWSR